MDAYTPTQIYSPPLPLHPSPTSAESPSLPASNNRTNPAFTALSRIDLFRNAVARNADVDSTLVPNVKKGGMTPLRRFERGLMEGRSASISPSDVPLRTGGIPQGANPFSTSNAHARQI